MPRGVNFCAAPPTPPQTEQRESGGTALTPPQTIRHPPTTRFATRRGWALFRGENTGARGAELAAWEVVEAGKPWREADADVCEAIDYLIYYGRDMLRLAPARQLDDLPGEVNLYVYQPRGVAVVIAPWNFPLAILTGMT